MIKEQHSRRLGNIDLNRLWTDVWHLRQRLGYKALPYLLLCIFELQGLIVKGDHHLKSCLAISS